MLFLRLTWIGLGTTMLLRRTLFRCRTIIPFMLLGLEMLLAGLT
jgi:hypothetical protein